MGCGAPPINFTSTGDATARLSRPSSMPDFEHLILSDSPLPVELQIPESEGCGEEKAKSFIQFVVSVSLVFFSLLSITATGAIMTVLNQVGKPMPVGYVVWMVVSITILALSTAGLCHILCGQTAGPLRFRQPQLHCWTPHCPSFTLTLCLPKIKWPSLKRRSATRPPQQSLGRLPHPNEFELDNLESQRRRPPTPYPGLIRPVPTVPPQSSLRDKRYLTLPLGFPVPPSGGIDCTASRLSHASSMSFQSAPRSVSPLSDVPPTPPPKEQIMSRFQSHDHLLPTTVSGETMAQSGTRTSIMTELCEAVQSSNPENNLGTAAQHYPLDMVGSNGRNLASVRSPRPAYPIELAWPSRSRGRENDG